MGLFHRLFGHRKKSARPQVVIDFEVQEHRLYLVIVNITDKAAYDLCFSFDQPLKGHNGSKDLTQILILKNITYLAPYKSIRLFIDPIEIFFHHLQTPEICIKLDYKDQKDCLFKEKNHYNLNLYRQLPNDSRVDFLLEQG